jgi:hypothetical protein
MYRKSILDKFEQDELDKTSPEGIMKSRFRHSSLIGKEIKEQFNNSL